MMTIALFSAISLASAQTMADKERLYFDNCQTCHDSSESRAPQTAEISKMSRSRIFSSMKQGVMKDVSAHLIDDELYAIIDYMHKDRVETTFDESSNQCKAQLEFKSSESWTRWGNNLTNDRTQNTSGITLENIGSLTLKWAYRHPDTDAARSQPVVAGNVIFMGTQDGQIIAMDLESGCEYWSYQAEAEVRSSLAVDLDENDHPTWLYFGDFAATAYAIDAATGALIWKNKAYDNPDATITGSPTNFKNMLIVPVSSIEVVNSTRPDYECCTFRGNIAAMNKKTGDILWKGYTVAEPEKQQINSAGAQMWGPSGAPVWSPPTIDEKRGLIYVGTGNNYTFPATDTSDAIVAFDLETGELAWTSQILANDVWNAACVTTQVNCIQPEGPDFDIGAAAILVTLPSGKNVLLGGQKSGAVFALDPDDNGKILWQHRLGRGGHHGGVHWGMTADEDTLYAAISDAPGHPSASGAAQPGLNAIDIATGKIKWRHLFDVDCDDESYVCWPGLSAAITATDDLIFAGGLDGMMHAFEKETGKEVWKYMTNRQFEAINGGLAQGGSVDSDGPILVDGKLIVHSGYGKIRKLPGDALLVFEVIK